LISKNDVTEPKVKLL